MYRTATAIAMLLGRCLIAAAEGNALGSRLGALLALRSPVRSEAAPRRLAAGREGEYTTKPSVTLAVDE